MDPFLGFHQTLASISSSLPAVGRPDSKPEPLDHDVGRPEPQPDVSQPELGSPEPEPEGADHAVNRQEPEPEEADHAVCPEPKPEEADYVVSQLETARADRNGKLIDFLTSWLALFKNDQFKLKYKII